MGDQQITESVVIEGPADPTGKVWEVVLISGGFNKGNNRFYTRSALESIASLASSNKLHCRVNHATSEEMKARPAGDVRDVAGWYTDVVFDEANNRVVGKLNMLTGEAAPYPNLPEAMREAHARGNPNLFDLSINGLAKSKRGRVEGVYTNIVSELSVLSSTDLVTVGGAYGEVQNILENESRRIEMNPDELKNGLNSLSVEEARELLAGSNHAGLVSEDTTDDPEGAGDPPAEPTGAAPGDNAEPVAESGAAPVDDPAPTTATADDLAVQAMVNEAVNARMADHNAYVARENQIKNSGLPAPLQERLITRNAKGEFVTDQALQEALEQEEKLAEALGGGARPDFAIGPVVLAPEFGKAATEDSWERYGKAMHGMISGKPDHDGIVSFRNIKESFYAYKRLKGEPYNPHSGRIAFDIIEEANRNSYDPWGSGDDADALPGGSEVPTQEAVRSGYSGTPSATYTDLLGTSMHRVFREAYASLDETYGDWKTIVSEMREIQNFKRHDWIRLGMYNTVPVVDEAAAYQPLVTPQEERVSMQLVKYGGTESITMESIADDDLNALSRIPSQLALRVAVDRYHEVFNIFTTAAGLGPNMPYVSGGRTLFHASFNNLVTTASKVLNSANLQESRLEMRQQAALENVAGGHSSDDVLLKIEPKYVLVPTELYTVALQLYDQPMEYGAGGGVTNIGTGGFTNNMNPLRGAIKPILVDYWTDANNWYLVADPARYDTIAWGYFPGHMTPQLLKQDQPTVGKVFTNDEITFRVRDIRDTIPMDHRSFRAHVLS